MRTNPQTKPKTKARNVVTSAPARKTRPVKTESTPKKIPRSVSKMQMCLDLLARRDGATLDDLSSATGWQLHSVRGFLSATVKKKLGLSLGSGKDLDGIRRYRLVPTGEARG